MRKWDIIKNIFVEKLIFWGKGFARLFSENKNIDWKILLITWWAIPESVIDGRVLKKRRDYIEIQITQTIKKSPFEKENKKNIYWYSGGWRWVNIPYKTQLHIKEQQVKESILSLWKWQKNIVLSPIIPAPFELGYRNKVEFSFWKYISKREKREEHFNVWFHKQWEFSKIEDFNGCPLICELQNTLYRKIKAFMKKSWLPVYDSMLGGGFFRHLIIRKSYFWDEIMLILWFNDAFDWYRKQDISRIKEFLISLPKKYNQIKSIYLSKNRNKADIALWDLECIYGQKYITETLHHLSFRISPTSFFQTNSSWAEKLYSIVFDCARSLFQGEKNKDDIYTCFQNSIVLDLYGWTGTIGMLFAKYGAKKVYSIELVESASKDGERNAKENHLKNIKFINKKVEDFLNSLSLSTFSSEEEKTLHRGNRDHLNADILVIDPPRAWMHPSVLVNILAFHASKIIYISCNPSTLVRDLSYILEKSDYRIEKMIPVDMFPQTAHIEVVVSLSKV